MEYKRTMVVGASPNPDRYSYKAVSLLQKYGHPVEAVGIKTGKIQSVEIQNGMPQIENIHTISLYIGPDRQAEYYTYLLNLKPKRIIFNPGTENIEFQELARKSGIEVVEDCTLVMLNGGMF